MSLTETKIRAARPRERAYKIADGEGLTLLAKPNGARLWRFRYRYRGAEKMLSFGCYPDTSLAAAREKRTEARMLLARGVDPSAVRKAGKSGHGNTFRHIADEWLELQRKALASVTINKARSMLQTYVYPRLGHKPITDIDPTDLLRALRAIESKGLHETTHRVRQRVGQIYRYAIATGRADRDITADLRGALAPIQTQHHAAITEPARVGELLRAIDGYEGQPSVTHALRLAPLVFVRPGELRAARWLEFDCDNAEWRIPAERMKMGTLHVVPLARQSLAILDELRALTGDGKLLFPGIRSKNRPISDNSINAALRRLGYTSEQMTAHGFRTTASTLLNELGFAPDVIELQLAHVDRDRVRAVYNRSTRLAERRKLMQAWADYLDGVKADKERKISALRHSG